LKTRAVVTAVVSDFAASFLILVVF